MQNLAYKADVVADASELSGDRQDSRHSADICAACGEELFGPDAEACSWQAWGSFWEITGKSNVELACGACGEYLSDFFRDQK